LRFAEVMSVMADTPWTPREFLYYLHHATVPAFTIQTYGTSSLLCSPDPPFKTIGS
jgi:hypothetical protein